MNDLEKLKAKYVAGEASEEEIQKLLSACKEDRKLLTDLSEQVRTNRLLSTLSTDLELNSKEIIERLKHDSPDVSKRVISKIQSQTNRQKKIIFFMMAAAALISMVFFIPSGNIAVVDDTLEAKWDYNIHDQLKSGFYKLEKGYTRLKFNSGAVVLIEGPAEFTIVDNMNMFLKSGKVVADIPPPAHGFRIDTSTSNTIDLGTKFAVATDSTGQTEVHVIEGLVKSKSVRTKKYTELRKDEALKIIDKQNSEKLTADSGKFLTMLPPQKLTDLKYILWRFDEGKGAVANEETSGYNKNYPALLKAEADSDLKPKWVDGKFGNAIEFDGRSNFVETDFPGIGGSESRTVCFWIKSDRIEKNGFAIITWGSFEKYGSTWQISLNPISEDGPLGRIRCGTHRGQVIGTTDLADNKWHHVAVVMYGGPQADVSTNILIYVDGTLENASRKSVRQIDTDIESKKAVKVQMGKNAASNFNPNVKFKYFRGSLDEVYVFNYALKPQTIRQIIKNQLKIDESK